MKLKLMFLLLVLAVISVSFSFCLKTQTVDLLLKNIEAFAGSDEHGEVDPELVPYSKLGSKTIYFVVNGQVVSTQIPCCASDPSKYSGCARGLDNC